MYIRPSVTDPSPYSFIVEHEALPFQSGAGFPSQSDAGGYFATIELYLKHHLAKHDILISRTGNRINLVSANHSDFEFSTSTKPVVENTCQLAYVGSYLAIGGGAKGNTEAVIIAKYS